MEQTFKHYQIRASLGEGGYGEVYEAWDAKLCRLVALKRLKNGVTSQGSADLINEARLAASVQHAAFVKIYAIEDDDDSQSIVMELVRGKTLKQILEAGPVDAVVARDVITQIAHAMEEAHHLGLVHGDLKPSNVMQDATERIRILDFGTASHRDATTSLTQSDPQGTIAYMAPEMLTGARSSVATDVYALGVVLYELLTGTRPFAALHGLALAAALVQGTSRQWERLDKLDHVLCELVLAMTARDPTKRPPSMGSVLAALDGPARVDHITPGPQRKKISRNLIISLVALPLTAILLAGAWNLRANFTNSLISFEGFSASQELTRGLDALILYDRPGKLNEADEYFEHILAREPNSAAAVAGMSIMYSRRYQTDGQDEVWLRKAVAGAQQAIKLNDQLALAHAAYGIALERSGKNELAMAEFATALEFDPNNLFALLGKVKALTSMRSYDDARTNAEHGLSLYPRERSFADLVGQAYFEQGNYDAAEKAFRLSLKLQPDAVFAYANLSATLHRQGRTDQALQILQQGLQVRPNAWLYGNLGTILFARGDYPAAVAAFENAVSPVKGNPANYLGWANLADALLWIPGRKAEAMHAYAKASDLLLPRLERAPDNVLLVSRMALYVARSGNSQRAQALAERALRLAPNSMDVHFRAGMSFEVTGNRTRAIEEIVKARKLGYPEKSIESEPDLVNLRRDPRYPQQ